MEVIRARVLGFCMGVRHAVELASAEALQAKKNGFSVYTAGPLIHNPKVLDDLKALGVQALDDAHVECIDASEILKNCSVVICAHGISPQAESKLQKRGFRIIDATCPKVKSSQLKARELARAGYSLFLAGDKDHAEISGILGYAEEASYCVVIGNADEAEKAAASHPAGAALYKTKGSVKTALLGQTTISEEEYFSIGEAVKKYFPDLEIIRTICAATNDRRQALREMLEKVDAAIIAGGKESANTRRLLAAAQESGKPCFLAESAADIPSSFFAYNTVGICAGASTPDSVVNEIEMRLKSF